MASGAVGKASRDTRIGSNPLEVIGARHRIGRHVEDGQAEFEFGQVRMDRNPQPLFQEVGLHHPSISDDPTLMI